MKLLIRNLDRSISEVALLAMFEKHGAVQYCTVVMDKKTSKSKGFAFVEMPKVGEAKVAMQALNDTKIGDNKLRVKKAEYRSENQD